MNTLQVKGSPKRDLPGTTPGFFFGSAAVSLHGPTSVNLKDAMGLIATMLRLQVTIPSLSVSLLRIPLGVRVDRTGGEKPFYPAPAISHRLERRHMVSGR